MNSFFDNLQNRLFAPLSFIPLQDKKKNIDKRLTNTDNSWEDTLNRYIPQQDTVPQQIMLNKQLPENRLNLLNDEEDELEKKKELEKLAKLKELQQQKEDAKSIISPEYRREKLLKDVEDFLDSYKLVENTPVVQNVKSLFKPLNLPWKPEEIASEYIKNLDSLLKLKDKEKEKIKNQFQLYEYEDEFGNKVPFKYYVNQHLTDNQLDNLAEQNVIKNNTQIDSEGRPYNIAERVFKLYHSDKEREYREKNGLTEGYEKTLVREANDLAQMFYFLHTDKRNAIQEFWEEEGMEEMYKNNLKLSLVNSGKIDEDKFNKLWSTYEGRASLINYDLHKSLELRFPDSPIKFDIDAATQDEMFLHNMGMVKSLKDYKSISDSIREDEDKGKFDKLDEFVARLDTWYQTVGAGVCWLLGKAANGLIDAGSWLYNVAVNEDGLTFNRIKDGTGNQNLQDRMLYSDVGYSKGGLASWVDLYSDKQELELIDKEVLNRFNDDTAEQSEKKARAFEKLSEDVSPLYKNEKDDDFYTGDLTDNDKALKFNEYLVRGELYGWDRAALGVQLFWQNHMATMQSMTGPHPIKGTFFRAGRTLATLGNDIVATLLTGVGILTDPFILAAQSVFGEADIKDFFTVNGLTRRNMLVDFAGNLQETGCWSPELQAKYKDLGLNATQIYKTVAEENSFFSGADIWDGVGQYGFTAGTMLVSMGGSSLVKSGVQALAKNALKGMTIKLARRQALKYALKSAETISKEEQALINAVKSVLSKLYWGNMGVLAFTGTIEGAIESRSTYDLFMRTNRESIEQKINKEKELLNSQNIHDMASILKSKNPSMYENLSDELIVNNYYNTIKLEAMARAEDDALDAASLNFWLNAGINGILRVMFQAATMSNSIRSADFIRRNQRDLLNVTRNNGRFQVSAVEQSPWKKFGTLFKSSGGEFLEEYLQNISNAASQAALQEDMNGYLECLFDDKRRKEFQSNLGSAVSAFAKQVMDSATSKSAIKDGLMGFLSSAMGGLSPGSSILAFFQAKASGANTGQAWLSALKNIYSGGVKQELQKMRAEGVSQELTDWMTAVLNDKNGNDFLVKTMGAANLKERLSELLEKGDLMSARDTLQDYLTLLCLVMEAGQDNEQIQAIQRRWQAFSQFKDKIQTPEGKVIDTTRFFNDDGEFTLPTMESVSLYEAQRNAELESQGIADENERKNIIGQELEIATLMQSAVTTARQGSDYGNATDLEIILRIQKNAELFLELQQRVKEARKNVIKHFGGREKAVDPFIALALVRGIITQEDAQKRFESVHNEILERQQSLGESTMSLETARKAVRYGSTSNIDGFIKHVEDEIDERNKIINNTNQNTEAGKRKVLIALYEKALLEEDLKEAKADKARALEGMAQKEGEDNSIADNDYYDFTAADIAAMDINTRQLLISNYKDPRAKKLYSARQLLAVKDYINAVGSKSENYDQLSDEDIFTLLDDEKALNIKRETYNNMLRQYLANPDFLAGTVKALRKRARTAILREKYKDHLLVKDNETLREASIRIDAEIERLKRNGELIDSQVLQNLKNQVTHFANLGKLYDKLYRDRLDSVGTMQIIAEHSEDGLSQESEEAIAALSAMVESLDKSILGSEDFDAIKVLEQLKNKLESGSFDDLVNSLFQKDSKGNYVMDTFVTDSTPIKDLMQGEEYTEYSNLDSNSLGRIDKIMQNAHNLLSKYLNSKNSTAETNTLEVQELTPQVETATQEAAKSLETEPESKPEEKKTNTIVRNKDNVGEKEKSNVLSNIPDNKEINRFLKDHGAREARASYEFSDSNPHVYFMVSKKKGYNTNGPVIYVVAPKRPKDKKSVLLAHNGKLTEYVVLGVLPNTMSRTLNLIAAQAYENVSEDRDGALLYMDGGQLNLVHGSLGHVGDAINISSIDDANKMPLLKDQLDSDEKIDEWILEAHTEGGTRKVEKETPEVGGLFFKRAPKVDDNGVVSEVNVFDDFKINTSEGLLTVAEILDLISKIGEEAVIRMLSTNEFFLAFFEEWSSIQDDYGKINESKSLNKGTLLYNRLILNYIYLGNVQADWDGAGNLRLTVGETNVNVELPTGTTEKLDAKKLGLKILQSIYKDYCKKDVKGAVRIFKYYYPEIVYGFLPNSQEYKSSDGFLIHKLIELDALRLKGLIKAGLIIGYAATNNFRTIEVINPFYKKAPSPQRKPDDGPKPGDPAGAKSKGEVFSTGKLILSELEKKEVSNAKSFVSTLSKENEDGVHLENDDPHADFYEDKKDPKHKYVRVSHVEHAYSTENKEDEVEVFVSEGAETIPQKVSLPLGNTLDKVNRTVLEILENNPEILDSEDVEQLYNLLISHYEGGVIPNFVKGDAKILLAYLKDLIYLKLYCNSQGWVLFPKDVTVWGALDVVNGDGHKTGTIDVAGTLDLLAYDVKNKRFIVIDFKTRGERDPQSAYNFVKDKTNYRVLVSSYYELIKLRILDYNSKQTNEADKVPLPTEENKVLLFPVMLTYNLAENPNIISSDEKTDLILKNGSPLRISIWGRNSAAGGPIRAAGIAVKEAKDRQSGILSATKEEDIFTSKEALPFKGLLQGRLSDYADMIKFDEGVELEKPKEAPLPGSGTENTDSENKDDEDDDDDGGIGAASLDSKRSSRRAEETSFYNNRLRPVRTVRLGKVGRLFKNIKNLFKRKSVLNKAYYNEIANIFFEGDLDIMSKVVGTIEDFSKIGVTEALNKISSYYNNIEEQESRYLNTLEVRHLLLLYIFDFIENKLSYDSMILKVRDLDVDPSMIPEIMEILEKREGDINEYNEFIKNLKIQYASTMQLWREDVFQQRQAEMLQFFDNAKAKSLWATLVSIVKERLESIQKAVLEEKYDLYDEDWDLLKLAWNLFISPKGKATNIRTALLRIIKTTKIPEYRLLCAYMLSVGGSLLDMEIKRDKFDDALLEGVFESKEGIRSITISDRIINNKEVLERVILHECIHAMLKVDGNLKNMFESYQQEVLEKMEELGISNEIIDPLRTVDEFVAEFLTDPTFQMAIETFAGEINTTKLMMNMARELGIKSMSKNGYKAIHLIFTGLLNNLEDYTRAPLTDAEQHPIVALDVGEENVTAFIDFLNNRKSSVEEYEDLSEEEREALRLCFST